MVIVINKEPIKEEKKIVIDPNIVLPPAPQFKRCGADNLNKKPVAININTNSDSKLQNKDKQTI